MRALIATPEGSPKAERLWKLLTYLDRILFCPRPGGRTTRRGGAKHRRTESEPEHESGWSATIAERIRLFAAGEWAELWRETVRVSYAARDAAATGLRESPEKRRTRRANALWEEGELARACARHSRHLIQCALMTCCSSSGTSSLLARSVTTCPARIRRSAGPMTYAHASWRRSRRSSAPYRVAPARDQRARGLSTG